MVDDQLVNIIRGEDYMSEVMRRQPGSKAPVPKKALECLERNYRPLNMPDLEKSVKIYYPDSKNYPPDLKTNAQERRLDHLVWTYEDKKGMNNRFQADYQCLLTSLRPLRSQEGTRWKLLFYS